MVKTALTRVIMKRRLVIYNESKRHWLRQQLPPATLYVDPATMVATRQQADQPTKFFLMSFAAGFLAVTTFIF